MVLDSRTDRRWRPDIKLKRTMREIDSELEFFGDSDDEWAVLDNAPCPAPKTIKALCRQIRKERPVEFLPSDHEDPVLLLFTAMCGVAVSDLVKKATAEMEGRELSPAAMKNAENARKWLSPEGTTTPQTLSFDEFCGAIGSDSELLCKKILEQAGEA